MRKPVLFAVLASASILGWTAANIRADGEEDAAAKLLQVAREQGKRTAPASASVAEGLWASFDPADISPDFPLQSPVARSGAAAIYRLEESQLLQVSDYMHRKHHRCGGFFAYRTRMDAENALAAPLASAGGPYTIDQQAWGKPLIARVRESEIRSTIEGLTGFTSRYYTSDSGVAAAKWLQGRWATLAASLPGASAKLVAHPGWAQPSVVLTIPGAEKPEEIVVLGGHLDSINMSGWGDDTARAPGADDNASGIAVVTEAIRVLSEAGFRPKRTVQFMGYAAEEIGLRGSQDIAKQYAEGGKKVVAVIQYDMTNYAGSGDSMFFLADNVHPELSAFLGKLTDAYVGSRWSTTRCGYACSDHASWNRSGFPASAAFESSMGSMNGQIHTENDTLANSGGSAEHSVKFAKLAVAFAVETAKTSPSSRLAAIDRR